MDCYMCACGGEEKRSVALCPHCSVALCMKHAEELQTHRQGGMRYSCDHSEPRRPKLVATSGQP